MALRVLLADESTTIKKVMQLALQDFAVEVKAVHVGLDVVEVARQFKPDIIFADVLLQKKNGYEVSGELKRDPELRETPVVLMWSSFMDLDEQLANDSGADRRLEKPFDIENLRQVLLELVPRTHTQRLAHFLKFPSSFSEPMRKEAADKAPPAAQPPVAMAAPKPTAPVMPLPSMSPPITLPITPSTPTPTPTTEEPAVSEKSFVTSAWNMNDFTAIDELEANPRPQLVPQSAPALTMPTSESADDDDDDNEGFSEFRLQTTVSSKEPTPHAVLPPVSSSPSDEPGDEAWSHQDLGRFKLDLPPVTAKSVEHGIELELPDEHQLLQPEPKFELARSQAAPQPRMDEDTFAYAGVADLSNSETGSGEYRPVELPDHHAANDLILQPSEINGADELPGLGRPSLSLESQRPAYVPPAHDDHFPASDVGRIPQLTPDRLEEIIRSQSREIIETVVRRIVPDLASDIIREELQRLLEDTSMRESRR